MTKNDEFIFKILSATNSDECNTEKRGCEIGKNKKASPSTSSDNQIENNLRRLESYKAEQFLDKLLKYLEKQSDLVNSCLREKNEQFPQKSENSSCTCKTKEDNNNQQTTKTDNKYQIYLHVIASGDNTKHDRTTKTDDIIDEKSYIEMMPNDNIRRCGQREEVPDDKVNFRACEKKVDNFFQLADDICVAYLKRYSNDGRQNDNYGSPESGSVYRNSPPKDNNYYCYYSTGGVQDCCKPVESQERKDRCSPKSNRSSYEENRGYAPYPNHHVGSHHPLGSPCLELFENRYGQILRELHSKIIKHNEGQQTSQPRDTPRNYQGPTEYQHYPQNGNSMSVMPQFAYCCLHHVVHEPSPRQTTPTPNDNQLADGRCDCKKRPPQKERGKKYEDDAQRLPDDKRDLELSRRSSDDSKPQTPENRGNKSKDKGKQKNKKR